MSETGLARRVGTVARWPLGMGLASWRYLWRITPVHRSDEEGDAGDLGPHIPEALVDERLQPAEEGVGPFFRRRFSVRIEEVTKTPEALMSEVARDPNRVAPVEVAVFRKTRGDEGPLQVGEEYMVRMPGPWDGPLRVVDRTPTSFRLATLKRHLEAGQIEFRALAQDGSIRFEIESWARSGDRLSALLYDRARLAKEMQLHMWTHFCERVAKVAEGQMRGGIEVLTRRIERLTDA